MADPETSNITPLRKQVPCPQCGITSHRDYYPFCSKRCGDLDLGAWLNGSYKIQQTQEGSEE